MWDRPVVRVCVIFWDEKMVRGRFLWVCLIFAGGVGVEGPFWVRKWSPLSVFGEGFCRAKYGGEGITGVRLSCL